MAQIIEILNPFAPTERQISQVAKGIRPADWLQNRPELATLPIVCLINSEAILRKDWSSRALREDDTLAFIALPAGGGGGGKNPLATIATLALMVAAPALGATIATSIGVTSAIGTALITTGIKAIGSVLIGSLFPPGRAKLREYGTAPAPSPTYSLQARGNQARLGSAVPVLYGRHRLFPDLAAAPWYAYDKNEQHLYQLHVIGHGEYDIEALMIDDTPIDSFPDVYHEIIRPGGSITLFDPDVATAPEVAGQELLSETTVGPFILNPAYTRTTKIHIDLVWPRGLYYIKDNGSLGSKITAWKIEIRQIDDDGIATNTDVGSDGWLTLTSNSLELATNTPQRRSYGYGVSSGRYQIRMVRTDTKDTSSRVAHDMYWEAARASLNRSTDTTGLTLIAIKMRASNSLSSRSRGLFNCLVQRKLPKYIPPTRTSAGYWTEPVATRSIAWAIADIARASYGGKLQDKAIDFAALETLDATWNTRGDYFDAVFDNTITVWEALTRASRCGRSGCFFQGGKLRTVRDQAQTLPVALYGPRNMIKDGLKIDYRLSEEDTATAVTMEYHNGRSWKNDQLTVSLDGDVSQPAKISLFGATSREQVRREALYLARANRYRRIIIRFSTELDGLIPTYGDLIAITHPMPKWGMGGEIIDYDPPRRALELSEPVDWTVATPYLALRGKDGSLLSLLSVNKGARDTEAIVVDDQAFPSESLLLLRPIFAFGNGTEGWRLQARVLAVHPRAENRIEITAIAEDARVHQE